SWDTFSVYITIGDKHLKELESLLLRVIQPRPEGNHQGGKFANSENLRRRFKQDIKSYLGEQLELIIGGKNGLKGTLRMRAQEFDDSAELTKYLNGRGPWHLKAMYKRKTLHARVRRDGKIRFAGQLFDSPSGAACEAVGRAANGWHFWRYERAP